jgi:predicted kinase
MSTHLESYVAKVEEHLANTDETTASPVLVMLTGLPGTGKSHLAQRLAEVLPFAIIESDQVRKILFPECEYSAEESQWVHRTCHAVMERLLEKGVRVIYDATNLHERHREQVYRLADGKDIRLVIVKVVTPPEVVSDRLRGRHEVPQNEQDISDADLSVYQRMARQVDPISRNHIVVDTSQDLDAGITKLLRLVR